MARLVFPDEGSRAVFRPAANGRPLNSAAGAALLVYTDSSATTLADLTTIDGTPIIGGALNVDAYSRLPLFKGPADGTDTLYVVIDGGPITPVYARADDRIDAATSTAAAAQALAAAAETPAGAQAKATAARQSAIDAVTAGAGAALDTLAELGAQLASDESAAAALTTAVGQRWIIVNHGSTASTARPTSVLPVMWQGTVAPTNAVTRDRWYDESTELEKRYNGTAWAPVGSATYEPVGGLSVRLPLRNVSRKIQSIKGGTPGRVKILNFGDSYAQKIWLAVAAPVSNALGGPTRGAYFTGATGTGAVTINSTTGTVTDNTADFAHWPSGGTTTLGASGSRTYGVGGVATTCDTIRIFWINNGGTFKVQVDGVDNITPTVTSDHSLGTALISVARAAHTVTLVQLTGTPTVLTPGFEDSTLSGAAFINVSQGGIALTSVTAQAWTNFTTLLTTLAPDLITWEMRDISTGLDTALDSFFAAINAATGLHTDVLMVQSPPQQTGDADNVLANAVVKTKAAQYGALCFDSYTPFKDWATLNALGWGGDGLHVTQDADAFRGMLLLRDIGLMHLGQTDGLDTVATNVSARTALKVGDPANPDLQIPTDVAGALDAKLYIGRFMKFFEKTGATEIARIDTTGSTSFLPGFMRYGGSAGVGIGATGTRLIAATAASFATATSFEARAFALANANVANITGAATADVTSGLQILTLTGNVTSFAFSNPNPNAQEIEVHFVQDATGSRTLAGVNSAIKWAGGVAPTLTTTAGRRDIFRFRYQGSAYWETSRSLNVG